MHVDEQRRRRLMARRATGQVIPPKDGRAWAIRFRAYGKRRYVTLGTAEDGWTASARRPSCGTSSPTWTGAPGSRMSPSPSRRRPRSDLPRVRVGVVRGSPARVEAAHGRGLRMGAHESPAAVLRSPPARRDNGRGGRPLPRGEGARGRAVAQLDQQDADAARAGARGRRRVRLPRPQPGARATAPAQSDQRRRGRGSNPSRSRRCSTRPAQSTPNASAPTIRAGDARCWRR